MIEITPPIERDLLELVLNTFPTAIRNRGEKYMKTGRIQRLWCLDAGREFRGIVRGKSQYQVVLKCVDYEWLHRCTCPMEFTCKHSYAIVRKVLIETEGMEYHPDRTEKKQIRGKPGGKWTKVTIAEELKKALGRKLSYAEKDYAAEIEDVWKDVKADSDLEMWHLEELELGIPPRFMEGSLRIWGADLPKNVLGFWQHVACYTEMTGGHYPKFMRSIGEEEFARKNVALYLRKKEISDWNDILERTNLDQVAPRLVDLQVCLLRGEAVLMCQQEPEGPFQQITLKKFRALVGDHMFSEVELPPPAALLLHSFERHSRMCGRLNVEYNSEDDMKMIGMLLRLPQMSSRMVNEVGQPVPVHAEQLRWEMTPAKAKTGDYKFKIVRADGSEPPPIWCTLGGEPLLYLTDEGVFYGPIIISRLDPWGKASKIPASVLETSNGVKLLTKLGLEPPPQLQRRVVTEKIIPRIKCNVDNRYPGSKTEVCFIEITANSSDGVIRDHWLGDSWGVVHGLGHKKKKAQRSATGKIVVYDRSLMNQIPALMIPLEMKRSGYEPRHHANITRKFPARFVEWLKSLPPEIPVELCGELDSLSRAPVAGTVRLEVAETEIDWFDLQVVLDVNDTNLNQDELKLLLNAKGNWVRLDDKGWQRLEFNLSEQEDETLARLGLNPREMSSEPQRMHALQLADPAAGKFLPEEQAKQIRRRADEIKTRVAPRVPPAVGGQLRPYQKDGFHFLAYLAANNFGGVLADDMGLGKTLQALTWLTWLLKQKGNRRKPSLVVCPKSVVDNWHAEADRFVPGLRVRIWLAADFRENLDKLGDPQEADLHVINYTQLRTARKSLVAVQWLAVILDEGQYIKNPNSQTAQAARSLKTGNRLVMTGTPIENRLLDLWSLMAFAMPGVLGNRTEFARVYNAKADPLARLRLSSRVRPFLLRRTKGQVAKDLPDRIEEDLFCELEGEQSRLYHAELKRAQQMLLSTKTQKELAKQRFHFLTSLLRLRQICCHPKLVNPGSNAASAKVESFLDQVTPLMESGQKVLVFSQFVENLKLLKEIVENKSWAHYYLAGDTQNRGELVEEFQTCPGAAIFLISLKAGGSGLNLMAASYVVLFDPWWNPAVENQAIDRTHRIGQSQNVIAFRLLAKGTIEEKIRIMQTQKQALAEDVLGEEKFAKALSLDDFKFLFSD